MFKSPMAFDKRFPVIVRMSVLVANEPVVSVPGVLMFLKTDSAPCLIRNMSGLPLPSTSATLKQPGVVSVARSTFGAKEAVVRDPEVLMFLKHSRLERKRFASEDLMCMDWRLQVSREYIPYSAISWLTSN